MIPWAIKRTDWENGDRILSHQYRTYYDVVIPQLFQQYTKFLLALLYIYRNLQFLLLPGELSLTPITYLCIYLSPPRKLFIIYCCRGNHLAHHILPVWIALCFNVSSFGRQFLFHLIVHLANIHQNDSFWPRTQMSW